LEGAPQPLVTAKIARTGDASLTLVSPGDRKIQVIKILRQATGAGLKETKALVDHPPALFEGIDRTYAEQLKAALDAQGATTRIKTGVSVTETGVSVTADAAPTPDDDSADTVTDQLERLATLHANGSLSDDEFAAAKAKVLGTQADRTVANAVVSRVSSA
jgi:hypothetical protein